MQSKQIIFGSYKYSVLKIRCVSRNKIKSFTNSQMVIWITYAYGMGLDLHMAAFASSGQPVSVGERSGRELAMMDLMKYCNLVA
jgi:hypothetical protein